MEIVVNHGNARKEVGMDAETAKALGVVEMRVEKMRRLVNRMYQTFYAAQIRRGNTHRRLLDRALRTVKAINRAAPDFTRLGMVARQVGKGRVLVTLDKREFWALKLLLRRKRG